MEKRAPKNKAAPLSGGQETKTPRPRRGSGASFFSLTNFPLLGPPLALVRQQRPWKLELYR
jgi:hypothetical protein